MAQKMPAGVKYKYITCAIAIFFAMLTAGVFLAGWKYLSPEIETKIKVPISLALSFFLLKSFLGMDRASYRGKIQIV